MFLRKFDFYFSIFTPQILQKIYQQSTFQKSQQNLNVLNSPVNLIYERCGDNCLPDVACIIHQQIRKSSIGQKMLKKRTSHRECFSNYSHSFPNLHSSPLIAIDVKQLCLKKSLFNPPEGLAESYAARRHIAAADVPIVEVVHYTHRWLLLQAPRYSRNFFRRLNSAQLGNPYEQLLKIFKGFVALTAAYGFFRPTVGMVFMEGRAVRVWINEDVFAGGCMMPLGKGVEGEREFVVAFLAMVEGEVGEWERVNGISTIDETLKLLDWRSRVHRGASSAVKASREVFCHPSDSKASFQPHQLLISQQMREYRSVRDINIGQQQSFFHTELSSSVTIKEQEPNLAARIPTCKKISGLFSDSKQLKNSFNDVKAQSGDVRKTKKKFNLTSTSSTLERFSQKWRSTAGKKLKKTLEEGEQPPSPTLHHQNSEPVSIQHEFQGLFLEEGGGVELGVQGNKQQLEKIAEEIQEVLIW